MQVTFQFRVGQRVLTEFGENGIVTVCAVDDGGVQYHVKTKSGGNWFKEDEVAAARKHDWALDPTLDRVAST